MRHSRRNPWTWIPSLYITEGLPNVIVTTVSVIIFKRLGLSNTEVALYTSWFNLPWMLKPLWSPIIEILGNNRHWIIAMQFIMGAALAGVALTLPTSNYLQWAMVFFFLMAFGSATHDIAADGYYMQALDKDAQSFFVGVRSTFYRVSMIAGQGLLVILAGVLEVYTKKPAIAWSWTLLTASGILFMLCLTHCFTIKKINTNLSAPTSRRHFFQDFGMAFVDFFKKKHIVSAIFFLLFYRLPEALLVKICPLFFLDKNNVTEGGLGLTTYDLGFIQGTIGVIGLILGGILGGIAASMHGFKRWLWPMVCAISIPNIVYVILAYYQPTNMLFINVCIFLEQFGYGFGFTAYMLFMLYFSQGKNQTAHYAFCTGLMTLSLILPGMVAGWLQENLGYLNFFILVVLLCPITFIVSAFIHIEDDLRKEELKN